MKNLKFFSLLLLFVIAGLGLRAQNGNVVASEVKVEDLGNGTGMIVVRLSGSDSYLYTGGTFTVSGSRVVGGSVSGGIGDGSRVIVQPPIPGNGNPNGNEPEIMAAIFPLSPGTQGNGDNEVELFFTWPPRFGTGLDYRYVCKRQIRRPTGI